MKKSVLVFFLVVFLVISFTGNLFAKGEKEEGAVKEATEETVSFQVAAFDCAYGLEWIEETIRVFEEKHPNVEVELLADPKIHEKLQPMFLSGNPPDVVNPGPYFDIWGAILEGQLKPLEKYLTSNAIGKEISWAETLVDNILSSGTTSDGHIYYVPMFVNNVGWFYNQTVWDKYGWAPPETWEDAYELFDAMRNSGIEPIANQGVWPLYIRYIYMGEFIARLAGLQKLEACWNLRADSWTDPEVVNAFAFIKSLADTYFQEGHLGMNHLQSQAEVMVGHAGMIGVGDWFPKEESEIWVEGDEIRATGFPHFPESKYPQNVYLKDIDAAMLWAIPEDSTNAELSADFLKLLYSEQIQRVIVNNTGNITIFKGSQAWVPDNKFGRAVKSCGEISKDASTTFLQRIVFDTWYPEIGKVIDNNILKMFSGEATPEELCASIQKVCDKVRNDPNAVKHHYSVGD